MPKNKEIHITYIGRLEKEKGIEIIIECIKKGIEENRNISWHICGDGSYRDRVQEIHSDNIHLYGHVSREKINTVLKTTDLVIMPSLFLETFGLVALETLTQGVPVCGFSQGGLCDFIHPSLALDRDDSVNSFFSILDIGVYPVMDVSGFSYDIWLLRLTELTNGMDKILLVNDYVELVGGAEQYVHNLAISLRSIGKIVEIAGYSGHTNRWIRIWLMILAPLAFWRGNILARRIHDFHPDLIWMHSTLRYIGPWGVSTIMDTHCQKYITHHDLGLISPRPSHIYNEGDIPNSPNLAHWIPKKINIIAITTTLLKWLYIQLYWSLFSKSNILHIVPSFWMVSYFQRYTTTEPQVFQHTNQSLK